MKYMTQNLTIGFFISSSARFSLPPIRPRECQTIAPAFSHPRECALFWFWTQIWKYDQTEVCIDDELASICPLGLLDLCIASEYLIYQKNWTKTSTSIWFTSVSMQRIKGDCWLPKQTLSSLICQPYVMQRGPDAHGQSIHDSYKDMCQIYPEFIQNYWPKRSMIMLTDQLLSTSSFGRLYLSVYLCMEYYLHCYWNFNCTFLLLLDFFHNISIDK